MQCSSIVCCLLICRHYKCKSRVSLTWRPAAVYTGFDPRASLAQPLPSPVEGPVPSHLSEETATSAVMTEHLVVPPMSPVSPPTSPLTQEASPQARRPSNTGQQPEQISDPKIDPALRPPLTELATPPRVRKRRRSTVYEDDIRFVPHSPCISSRKHFAEAVSICILSL